MAYVYKNFIPPNIAPKGSKSIGVYDRDGKLSAEIPLGKLAHPVAEPLYSFGLVSDIHISHLSTVVWQPVPKFDNALSFFEEKGCAFCVACGDLTNTGFYLRMDESTPGTEQLDERAFTMYKGICDNHTIPVYELCGNHESYYNMPITNNMSLLEKYTVKGVLSYTVEYGNDLFIFCGQNRMLQVMSDEDFAWLSDTLEENKDKRCFVFIHSFINADSGNPLNVRDNSIFEYNEAQNSAANKNAFIRLMSNYKNAVLFHGHSHMKFESQQYDDCANYTERNGIKSIHIPGLSTPRTLNEDGTWSPADDESYGYVVDVYENCIVLNGMDFVNNKPVPLGVYKIDFSAI